MNNLEFIRFENAPIEIIDGDRGVNYPKQSDFKTSGHCLFLNTGNVRETGFDFSDCSFISEEVDNKLGKGKLAIYDIVFTTRGTVGNLAFYNERVPFENIRINSGMVIFRVDKERVFPRYLYFILKSRIFKEQVRAFATGSAQPQLPIRDIKRIEFPLPSFLEQHAIAEILATLEDKIELNRRMNDTLESMARAVFREIIKARGGVEKTLGDVVTIVGGSTPSTSNPAFWDDGDIHWVTPKDLAPLQSPILLDTNNRITELGLKEISSGLLPVGTVLLSSRAPIGYLAISQIPVAINQGFIAIKCTEELPNYFILNWVKENMEEIIGRANGTTFLEISKSNFRPMKINVPSYENMRIFIIAVEPLYQKVVANLKESQTLSSLRDTLLPRLISGEIKVISGGQL